jgi:hypothetical protein
MANLSQEATAMKLHGIENQHAHALGQLKRKQPWQEQVAKVKVEETKEMEAKPLVAIPEGQVEGEAKGVIRLLQQGHFKGVADVRLRIVHHKQIHQVTTQSAADILELKGQTLISDVGEELGIEFGIAQEELQEAIAAFQEKVGTNDASPDGAKPNNKNILSIYREAFGELMQALSKLEPVVESEDQIPVQAVEDGSGEVSSTTNEEPVTTTAEQTQTRASEVQSEPTVFQSALAALEEKFSDDMQSIEANMNDLMSLPALSQPTGNGVAYEKFLGIYNALQGAVEAGLDDPASSGKSGIETNV